VVEEEDSTCELNACALLTTVDGTHRWVFVIETGFSLSPQDLESSKHGDEKGGDRQEELIEWSECWAVEQVGHSAQQVSKQIARPPCATRLMLIGAISRTRPRRLRWIAPVDRERIGHAALPAACSRRR